MRSRQLAQFLFLASAVFLALTYGYMARALKIFPHSWLMTASDQVGRVLLPVDRISSAAEHGTSGATPHRPEALQPGLTLVSTHRGDGGPVALLLDAEGTILHEWRVDSTIFFERGSPEDRWVNPVTIHGMHLFPNGDLLVILDYVGIARLDACGDVLWSRQNNAHHAIAPAEDGTFWIPVTREQEVPSSASYPDGYPGLEGPVHHDALVHLDADGEPLARISLLDVVFDNGMERFLAKSRPHEPGDILHVNDVEPLPQDLASEYPGLEAGDLLVSALAPSLVLALDPETGVVRWHHSDRLVQQHDADFLGNGWIGVFNNNRESNPTGALLGGTRVIAFQPHTDSVETLFPGGEDPEPFYTPFLGKWQLLENGNMLLTEGVAGRVVEVDPEGRAVWEWVAPTAGSGAVFHVTEGTRYGLDPEVVRGWRCSGDPGSPT